MDQHKTGYRLIFIHGAGADGSVWGEQLAFFRQAEALTLPGHRSNESVGNEGSTSIDLYASRVHDWIVSEETVDRKPGKVILIGHSMGGAIALAYALTYPEKLAGLVLAATGPKLRVGDHLLGLLQNDYPAAVEFLVENLHTSVALDEMRKRTRETFLKMNPAVTYNDFVACNNFDVSGELSNIRGIPVLVVGGTADVMTPPKLSNRLADGIPGAKLALIDAAPHRLMQEKALEFNRLVDEFLAGLPLQV